MEYFSVVIHILIALETLPFSCRSRVYVRDLSFVIIVCADALAHNGARPCVVITKTCFILRLFGYLRCFQRTDDDIPIVPINDKLCSIYSSQIIVPWWCKSTVIQGTKLKAYGSCLATQIAKFVGPAWGPTGSCRPQMGHMKAP